MSRKTQYKICKERGHRPSEHVLSEDGIMKHVCFYCGTAFWYEEIIHEQNIPE